MPSLIQYSILAFNGDPSRLFSSRSRSPAGDIASDYSFTSSWPPQQLREPTREMLESKVRDEVVALRALACPLASAQIKRRGRQLGH